MSGILIIENPTDPGDDRGGDCHSRRTGDQTDEEYQHSGRDGPHRPGKVLIDPMLHGGDLTADHEPYTDRHQKKAKKEIGSISSHRVLLVEEGCTNKSNLIIREFQAGVSGSLGEDKKMLQSLATESTEFFGKRKAKLSELSVAP
jgi:hypothetical protein